MHPIPRTIRHLRTRWRRLRRLERVPVDPAIEAYLEGLLPLPDDPVRHEMEAHAARHGFPIVGPLVGAFLESVARGAGARRVFEFGSGYGYSAYWFARAVGPGGEVVCSDGDPANAAAAGRNLRRAGLADRVTLHTGIAQDVFRATEGTFDVCYNDVDKGDYPEVWRLARQRLRPGGLYVADNVLWYGQVTRRRPRELRRAFAGWTEAIREHNRRIFADPEFDAWIQPIRDGVLVARRRDAREAAAR